MLMFGVFHFLSKYYLCNCCFSIQKKVLGDDLREGMLCRKCHLNSRQRAILFAVQKIKFSYYLHKGIQVRGISDGDRLKSAFTLFFGSNYLDHEFHVEPFLDISKLPARYENSADLVVCSEVLEHVKPPVSEAFSGLFKFLRTGGFLVLSVPHRKTGEEHVEHFPILVESELILGKKSCLKGIDKFGQRRVFDNLHFHGGSGETLEYRIFSEDSLVEHLLKVGFIAIKPIGNVSFLGFNWEPWSRVWIARKP